jgi:hypothetical protein
LIPGSEIAYSSYPGILSSIDDFYVTNARLAIIETTIGNSNADLWKYVTPKTNLYWIRNLVAHRLSFLGSDWAQWFSLYNSGTLVQSLTNFLSIFFLNLTNNFFAFY